MSLLIHLHVFFFFFFYDTFFNFSEVETLQMGAGLHAMEDLKAIFEQ